MILSWLVCIFQCQNKQISTRVKTVLGCEVVNESLSGQDYRNCLGQVFIFWICRTERNTSPQLPSSSLIYSLHRHFRHDELSIHVSRESENGETEKTCLQQKLRRTWARKKSLPREIVLGRNWEGESTSGAYFSEPGTVITLRTNARWNGLVVRSTWPAKIYQHGSPDVPQRATKYAAAAFIQPVCTMPP